MNRQKTIEPVEKLSGRELNAAVAERVMGWRRKPNGMMHGRAQEVFVDDRDNTHSITCGCAEDFNPSCTIEAAMQVAERMREQGWSFACTLYAGQFPYASFCKGTVVTSRNAEADSLPEAICRAALLAVASNER
jgi:hypothetical protein